MDCKSEMELEASEQLILEFEELRPKPYGIKDLLSVVFMFAILTWSVTRFVPDSNMQPIFVIFVIVIVGIQSTIVRENRKTNKRIDLLSRMINDTNKID